jgi:hypothetical protein
VSFVEGNGRFFRIPRISAFPPFSGGRVETKRWSRDCLRCEKGKSSVPDPTPWGCTCNILRPCGEEKKAESEKGICPAMTADDDGGDGASATFNFCIGSLCSNFCANFRVISPS